MVGVWLMFGLGTRNLIRLSSVDLDRPIYRIYALDRFMGMLATGEDALVNPTKWQDPFENFFLERTEVVDGDGAVSQLSNLAGDWYGQCWSLNEETDAMWRIYSPEPSKQTGVKVRTTVQRLLGNLCAVGSHAAYLQFFIGKVDYVTQDDITSLMSGLTFAGMMSGGQGDRFANLLCVKRTAFEHEQEVRLLYHDVTSVGQSKRGNGGLFKFALDPSSLFDEVVLDPRLVDGDAVRIERQLVGAGCGLPISRSPLYQSPSFRIRLT